MVVFKNKSFQLEMPNEVHTGQVTQCLEFSLKFYSKKESKSKNEGRGKSFVSFVGCCSWVMGIREFFMLFPPLVCNI